MAWHWKPPICVTNCVAWQLKQSQVSAFIFAPPEYAQVTADSLAEGSPVERNQTNSILRVESKAPSYLKQVRKVWFLMKDRKYLCLPPDHMLTRARPNLRRPWFALFERIKITCRTNLLQLFYKSCSRIALNALKSTLKRWTTEHSWNRARFKIIPFKIATKWNWSTDVNRSIQSVHYFLL